MQVIKLIWLIRGKSPSRELQSFLKHRTCTTWKPQQRSRTTWKNSSWTWLAGWSARHDRTPLWTMSHPPYQERGKVLAIWLAVTLIKELACDFPSCHGPRGIGFSPGIYLLEGSTCHSDPSDLPWVTLQTWTHGQLIAPAAWQHSRT